MLQEDKPGLRLYAPINDRFFGREAELGELIAKFDDPRGRGVSIAGFGGIGKTELGIRLTAELHRRGKFRNIYSGSAKQTLLGPGGPQQTDPVFIDLASFLADLAGWLGFNPGRVEISQLAESCISELSKLQKVLLFVDNLETVTDRDLLSFLDNNLPENCWLIATARVHKVRNFVYPKELGEMDIDDAARLLRYELKRQGLNDLASQHVATIREKVKQLYCHPLAVRWFAWACSRDASVWQTTISGVDKRELENFCVAHTLGHLGEYSQKVLGAVLAIGSIADATDECIRETSGVPESLVDGALWELECSGLLYANTDEDGITTYSIAPLSQRPMADLARRNGWEGDYVQNLQYYMRQQRDAPPDSPLARDLLKLEPRRIQYYTSDERRELIVRIDRALPRCRERFALKLKVLKAECERHSGMPISADDLYKECAEAVLAKGPISPHDVEGIRILLEAATVAKVRSQTEPQIRRAISYLEAIQNTDVAPLRVLGTLTEMYAILGDRQSYERYLARVQQYRDSHDDIRDSHLYQLEEALERARSTVERRVRMA
ncbi:MAG TPA: ATP-binding protein [Terriglobales bacterium]|nr:ATP-binding protein [Terriglobales bacterium]